MEWNSLKQRIHEGFRGVGSQKSCKINVVVSLAPKNANWPSQCAEYSAKNNCCLFMNKTGNCVLTEKRLKSEKVDQRMLQKNSLRTGFEPARGDPKRFLISRLNHSAIAADNLPPGVFLHFYSSWIFPFLPI